MNKAASWAWPKRETKINSFLSFFSFNVLCYSFFSNVHVRNRSSTNQLGLRPAGYHPQVFAPAAHVSVKIAEPGVIVLNSNRDWIARMLDYTRRNSELLYVGLNRRIQNGTGGSGLCFVCINSGSWNESAGSTKQTADERLFYLLILHLHGFTSRHNSFYLLFVLT